MPRIRFKSRRGATVQLVRHIYDPSTRRSRTATVGSIRLDTDPDDAAAMARLRPGEALGPDDVVAIQAWLRANGDPFAQLRRQALSERIEKRLRAELKEASGRMGAEAALADAVDALTEAENALNEIVAKCNSTAVDPRGVLRPAYLRVYAAWIHFMKVAQSKGIAKTARRQTRPRVSTADRNHAVNQERGETPK